MARQRASEESQAKLERFFRLVFPKFGLKEEWAKVAATCARCSGEAAKGGLLGALPHVLCFGIAAAEVASQALPLAVSMSPLVMGLTLVASAGFMWWLYERNLRYQHKWIQVAAAAGFMILSLSAAVDLIDHYDTWYTINFELTGAERSVLKENAVTMSKGAPAVEVKSPWYSQLPLGRQVNNFKNYLDFLCSARAPKP
jgi:hypothetical protein